MASTNLAAATISTTGLVMAVAVGTTMIQAGLDVIAGATTLAVLASPLPPVQPAASQGGQSPPLPAVPQPAGTRGGVPAALPPPR